MSEVIVVAPRRAFGETFQAGMRISCARPRAYLTLAMIVRAMALLLRRPASLQWSVFFEMVTAFLALLLYAVWQAAYAVWHERCNGRRVYLFDAWGVCVRNCDVSRRLPWSQMSHVKVTRDRWLIYVEPSSVRRKVDAVVS
ncbi:hypothetical protein [Dyella mobilis]|uniref:Toxin CptA n=1 Tax=Dyella mobilis TaxID=1849582 RepID=A0ABS2KER5_9GAMM|nr:hypothetical protein [Dyella mobilis]MBM7129252.1 hypothetical protein [Dyella mobilis]